MNNCSFFGIIDGDIEFSKEGAFVSRFMLKVEETRKAKSTKEYVQMYTVIGMEAWDTAAQKIYHQCQHGSKIWVVASVKYSKDTDEIYFRVNNFGLL